MFTHHTSLRSADANQTRSSSLDDVALLRTRRTARWFALPYDHLLCYRGMGSDDRSTCSSRPARAKPIVRPAIYWTFRTSLLSTIRTSPNWIFFEFNFGKLSAVVIVAYIIGFIPAAVAGYFIGAIGMRYGGVRLSHAALIGTMVGLMTAIAFAIISAPTFRPENAVVLFLICVSATIVCWLVAGRWWHGTEIADTELTG
jgi:hypothetical protein